MHTRTKFTNIPHKTKMAVYDRDEGRCIFCGSYYSFPEAHIVPRSHGGLGVEQNIVTVCRKCHDQLDNSTDRPLMLACARAYLLAHYPGWNEEDLIYDKYKSV